MDLQHIYRPNSIHHKVNSMINTEELKWKKAWRSQDVHAWNAKYNQYIFSLTYSHSTMNFFIRLHDHDKEYDTKLLKEISDVFIWIKNLHMEKYPRPSKKINDIEQILRIEKNILEKIILFFSKKGEYK